MGVRREDQRRQQVQIEVELSPQVTQGLHLFPTRVEGEYLVRGALLVRGRERRERSSSPEP
jgi:hypothetical protein